MTTFHISNLIGHEINYTRRELQKMSGKGMVKKITIPGKTLKWSALGLNNRRLL